jgi:orotate phosphoribosyltransferase
MPDMPKTPPDASADTPAVIELLERLGAIITDSHVIYTSGRHGSSYVNKDALYPHTAETSLVCARLAEEFATLEVEVVAAPAVGGVIMSQWVAYHLTALRGKPVLAIYAEESGIYGQRIFRRGYDELIPGKRVLVVEDVLTTGGSAQKVISAVRAAGGHVSALGALCNRGGLTAESLGVPRMHALISLALESWHEQECPLCAAGVPVNTSVGKGAAFLAKQAQHKAENE